MLGEAAAREAAAREAAARKAGSAAGKMRDYLMCMSARLHNRSAKVAPRDMENPLGILNVAISR